jgi:formylglycine-generating enzyme required for sulfatase activity/cephalosporin-C deacetylase-like acetyl esterase
MTLAAGTRLGPYEVVSLLGKGGMGEVYRAKDLRLGRDVAVKVIPEDFLEGEEGRARFEREARLLASLNHPGIAVLYSFEEIPGSLSSSSSSAGHVLVMELVEGDDLTARIASGLLSLEESLSFSRQIAEALEAAHAKGIVHRDLKPANVKITSGGRVKLLDFGLAKRSGAVGADDETSSAPLTRRGAIVGTLPYMSPEQVEGKPVGPPSDVFSFGIVLYEMATGRRPFAGDSAAAVISAILRDVPPPPSQLRKGAAKELDGLVARCLEKDPARRPSAADVRTTVARLAGGPLGEPRRLLARPAVLASIGLVLLALVTGTAWLAVRRSRDAAFVAGALPRIERLALDTKYRQAFDLARETERVGGAAAVPKDVWDAATYALSVHSQPEGASVSFRAFASDEGWTRLGTTPLESVRVPKGTLQWRAELSGHLAADFATSSPGESVRFEMRKESDADRDMVLVPGGKVRLWVLGSFVAEPSVALGPFLIDRHEVTNREFARFVESGGYREEAMARFRDTTGRPGPATWRLGTYPDGEEDVPVHGVSWYEAAAYADFAGKELPTVYDWYLADTGGDLQDLPGLVLPASNYEGKAPRPAAAARVASAYGVLDMAGNVREWSRSATDGGRRLVLGGAFTDPSYQYLIPEVRDPSDRAVGNGFRCVKRLGKEPLPEAATRILLHKPSTVDPNRRVPDEMYATYARFFETRPVPLEPHVESTDESPRHWVRQKVSYAAGYGGERVTAWLYLPKSARPPYQVVIQMGGASTFARRTSAKDLDIFGFHYAEYLIRGGRAVLLPLWKGSYERSDGFGVFEADAASYREHVFDWVADLRHSVDYLETRKDVDASKLAYQGISGGATWGPQFLALEPRLRTGVFLLGGLLIMPLRASPLPPEIDMVTYAPRVKVPVLMLNGRNDAIFPYETSQTPLMRLLGTTPEKKKHVTFPGGHSTYGWRDELVREALDWLDRWLGPVVPPASPAAR